MDTEESHESPPEGSQGSPVVIEEDPVQQESPSDVPPTDNDTEDLEEIPRKDENVTDDDKPHEKLDVEITRIQDDDTTSPQPPSSADSQSPETEDPLFDDPSDEDDGEGEWITPSNVGLHKSRALHLLPDEANKKRNKKPAKQIPVGCMTADFAMQNVLLQMNLSLVGVEGKKIERVKTWVLRCHACFKSVPQSLASTLTDIG